MDSRSYSESSIGETGISRYVGFVRTTILTNHWEVHATIYLQNLQVVIKCCTAQKYLRLLAYVHDCLEIEDGQDKGHKTYQWNEKDDIRDIVTPGVEGSLKIKAGFSSAVFIFNSVRERRWPFKLVNRE